MKYLTFILFFLSAISVSAQRELQFDSFPPVKNNESLLEGSGFEIPFMKIGVSDVDTSNIYVRELLISKDPITLGNYTNYLNLRKSDGDDIKTNWLTIEISQKKGSYYPTDEDKPVSNLSYEAIEEFFEWLTFTINEYANYNGEYVIPSLSTPSLHEFGAYLSHMSFNYKSKNKKPGKMKKGSLTGVLDFDRFEYNHNSVLSNHRISGLYQKSFNRDITIETTVYQYSPDGTVLEMDPEYRIPGSFHLAISILGRSSGAEY